MSHPAHWGLLVYILFCGVDLLAAKPSETPVTMVNLQLLNTRSTTARTFQGLYTYRGVPVMTQFQYSLEWELHIFCIVHWDINSSIMRLALHHARCRVSRVDSGHTVSLSAVVGWMWDIWHTLILVLARYWDVLWGTDTGEVLCALAVTQHAYSVLLYCRYIKQCASYRQLV